MRASAVDHQSTRCNLPCSAVESAWILVGRRDARDAIAAICQQRSARRRERKETSDESVIYPMRLQNVFQALPAAALHQSYEAALAGIPNQKCAGKRRTIDFSVVLRIVHLPSALPVTRRVDR
jgi:hypothetical protein